jgi:hypothetical protein
MNEEMTKQNSAKELFWYYACNHFFLDRDGALEKYHKLGGSGEKEKAWRDEYIDFWLSKLGTTDLTTLFNLRNTGACEILEKLIGLNDYGDDYSKFWFAYTIADLAQNSRVERTAAKKAREKAQVLWEEILSEPRGISKDHKKEIRPDMLEALGANTAEEYLINYSKRKLKEMI